LNEIFEFEKYLEIIDYKLNRVFQV
jgi:hypothetical protein